MEDGKMYIREGRNYVAVPGSIQDQIDVLRSQLAEAEAKIHWRDEELADLRGRRGEDGRNGPIEAYYLLAEDLGVQPHRSVIEAVDELRERAEEAESQLAALSAGKAWIPEPTDADIGLPDGLEVGSPGWSCRSGWMECLTWARAHAVAVAVLPELTALELREVAAVALDIPVSELRPSEDRELCEQSFARALTEHIRSRISTIGPDQVVVGREELEALVTCADILIDHMASDGGVPMSDALAKALDIVDPNEDGKVTIRKAAPERVNQ